MKRKPLSPTKGLVPSPEIGRRIYEIRSQRVILDADLAALYGVTTKRLNEQLRRNYVRFPTDFAFQLTKQEVTNLRSQIATSSLAAYGGPRYRPHAFTEYGAIMAANILRSDRAIFASIEVVRAFIRLREMVISHRNLERTLSELERRYDAQFRTVFDAIRQIMTPPAAPHRRIGF